LADIERATLAQAITDVAGLTSEQAARLVEEFEVVFAKPFAARLLSLRLLTIVQNKNPYLYRASGIRTCENLVERVLNDFVSASVEGDFGKFFESVARVVSGGVKPVGGGEVDLDIRVGDVARLYAIKSGPKGFNSSSYDKAKRDLNSAERRLRQDRLRTEKKVAFAYGRKHSSFADGIERLSSKQFWSEISGDEAFYEKLLRICGILAPLYTADMEAPYERLLAEAHDLFCVGDEIDWDKILKLVSE
jgi:hypothetical protein